MSARIRKKVQKMKIAFVTYPTATLLPPYHGTMGATIYVIASMLAKSCEVLVYGLDDYQRGAKSGIYEGARYRFFRSSVKDRLLLTARDRLSRLMQIGTPVSTSDLLFPSFGRQVARDLERQYCDVIHVQHCSQYVPSSGLLIVTPKLFCTFTPNGFLKAICLSSSVAFAHWTCCSQ